MYTFEERWESGPAINLQKMPILAKKKSSFQMKLILGGYVDKQNCCICGTENLHAYIEQPTYPKRVTDWCGLWSRGIIGPFFFENEEAEAVTLNGDRYRAMLKEFLFRKIEEEDIGNIWFKQNGSLNFIHRFSGLKAKFPQFRSVILKLIDLFTLMTRNINTVR